MNSSNRNNRNDTTTSQESSTTTRGRCQPNPLYSLEGECEHDILTKDSRQVLAASADEKNVSKVMCERLNQLSMEERTQGIHELHGVADDIAIDKESPQTLRTRIQTMDWALQQFSNEDTVAYRKALEIDSDYVDSIKLLCLRADYYDSQKAAARLVSLFTFKQSLFGDEKLGRDIVMDDLDEDDIAAFKQGAVQLLSQRDRAGRAIIMLIGACRRVSIVSWSRLYYYCNMEAIRDEEIQKKGIVFVLYSVGQREFASERPEQLARVWRLLPTRVVAAHVCYDSNVMSAFVNKLSTAMESHFLCRFRSHFGSYLECTYILMTFGIADSALPINMKTGELDLKWHHQWVGRIKTRERLLKDHQHATAGTITTSNTTTAATALAVTSVTTPPIGSGSDGMASSNKSIAAKVKSKTGSGGTSSSTSGGLKEVSVLGQLDIPMRRGRHATTSLGYVRFRSELENRFEEFNIASKQEKIVIVDDIVKDLRAMGCRFVRITPHGILEESKEISRDKVSHTLRNMRMMRKKQEKKSNGGGYQYADDNLRMAKKRGSPTANAANDNGTT